MTSSLICYSLGIVGAAAIIRAASIPSFEFAGAWARKALLLSGVFILFWSSFGLLLLFNPSSFSDNLYFLIEDIRRGLGGASSGLLIFLFISKGFPRRSRSKAEQGAAANP